MAWTAPRTYTTGEVITASIANTHWRDNLRYLKGLDGGVTIEDDLDIGANLLKTTNLSLKEGTSSIWYLRTAADDAYTSILGTTSQFSIFQARTGTTSIDCRDVDTNYIAGRARDSGSGLVEIFRMVGAADPYFQMTLPQVLKPGTAPGTLVEGHFWYLATDDKVYYRDASANIELVGINSPTRGDVLYRGASNWLNLAKGSAGQILVQGANDPSWASQNKIIFSTASLFSGTAPTSFTDLDISGTVGSNQAVCLIKVKNNSGDAATQRFQFRKDDDGDSFVMGVSTTHNQTVADGDACYLIIVTDGTGVVEWKSNQAKSTAITMEAYLI